MTPASAHTLPKTAVRALLSGVAELAGLPPGAAVTPAALDGLRHRLDDAALQRFAPVLDAFADNVLAHAEASGAPLPASLIDTLDDAFAAIARRLASPVH